jgi:hypothetical protein
MGWMVRGEMRLGTTLQAKDAIRLSSAKDFSELRCECGRTFTEIKSRFGPLRCAAEVLAQKLVANRKGHLLGDAATNDMRLFWYGTHARASSALLGLLVNTHLDPRVG